MREDADLKWVLIVEDDCVPCLHPAAESQWSAFYGPAWQVAWRHIAKAMESCEEDFDFAHRHVLLDADLPEDESDAVVRPALAIRSRPACTRTASRAIRLRPAAGEEREVVFL